MPFPISTVLLVAALCAAIFGLGLACGIALGAALLFEAALFVMAGMD